MPEGEAPRVDGRMSPSLARVPVSRLAPLAAGALLLLSACAEQPGPGPATGTAVPPVPDQVSLKPVAFTDLPGWGSDDLLAAKPALTRSCDKLTVQDDSRPVGPNGTAGKVADWRAACAALAQATTAPAVKQALETHFRPMEVSGREGRQGLFTGYYEAELRGARRPGGTFQTPLYRRPEDLITVELADWRADWRGQRIAGRVVEGRLRPYADRKGIEGGALKGRGLELVWVDDPVDAFFLQIQGSGRVILPDGQVMRIGFAAQNGHAYVPIGRVLADKGAIPRDEVSMQTIRAWLAAHPVEAAEVMNANPSYVFFRELSGDGPLGAQGAALTPGRSLAVDPSFMPLGAPVWLDLEEVPVEGTKTGPLRRLVVAQDTGGAIRGPVRGDLFWGYGDIAADRAGRMKAKGRYFLLLPKTAAPVS